MALFPPSFRVGVLLVATDGDNSRTFHQVAIASVLDLDKLRAATCDARERLQDGAGLDASSAFQAVSLVEGDEACGLIWASVEDEATEYRDMATLLLALIGWVEATVD